MVITQPRLTEEGILQDLQDDFMAVQGLLIRIRISSPK